MAPGNPKQLGNYVRRTREAQGISLRKLAAEADVALGWLHNFEQGHYPSPAPDRLQRIAEALVLDFEDLYALAGYDRAERLPSLGAYLRSRYDDVPEDVLEDVEDYFRRRAGGPR